MPAIRKGSEGSKEEGGGAAPSGMGGNVHVPKNDGASDRQVEAAKADKTGINIALGK